jgi:hypothetical protein
MDKLKLWKDDVSWEEAEANWEAGAKQSAKERPVKTLGRLPIMPGITSETAKNLKWKSLKWMIVQDHGGKIRKGLLTHPLKYGWAFIKSVFRSKSFKRTGDFFLYGLNSIEEFQKLLHKKDTLFVLGFSYCHKPFECPSGRFNDQCIHDPNHPVCRQCFIGKAVNAASDSTAIPVFIPTIHYIGAKIFDLAHANPSKQILFLITACEMTLEMFGDWGNMVGIKGIGVRLDGRICNTMKAFELSEQGIKPGLTVVLEDTQKKVLALIRHRNDMPVSKEH